MIRVAGVGWAKAVWTGARGIGALGYGEPLPRFKGVSGYPVYELGIFREHEGAVVYVLESMRPINSRGARELLYHVI